jgi:hypothetical protein
MKKIDLQEAFIVAAQLSDPYGHPQPRRNPENTKEKDENEETSEKDLKESGGVA